MTRASFQYQGVGGWGAFASPLDTWYVTCSLATLSQPEVIRSVFFPSIRRLPGAGEAEAEHFAGISAEVLLTFAFHTTATQDLLANVTEAWTLLCAPAFPKRSTSTKV